MIPPFRRNILKAKMLNKKNRHVLTYVSVFFVLTFAVIFLSSFKPVPKTNSTNFTDNDDTIYLYDTVYYYDTTYVYDTVYLSKKISDTVKIILEKPKSNILFKGNFISKLIKQNKNYILPSNRYLLSFDFLLSPMYSYHSFSSNYIYQDISDINKLSVKEGFSSTIGLGINYHKPFSTFSSGVYYTNYREKFNYQSIKLLLDTIVTIDSIKFINIDTLLATGDTLYYYILESDTAFVPEIIRQNEKAKNSYTYIEIPLIFSFNFHKYKLSISPQIGIITSFYINSKGKVVSLANINQSIDIEKETEFANINFSIYGGVKLNFFLTKRFDLFTSGYFRKNLNSIFIDYPIISRFNTFGLYFGLKYKILY